MFHRIYSLWLKLEWYPTIAYYIRFTLSVRPFFCPSVWRLNRVRSVFSTRFAASISYVHILSTNFRRQCHVLSFFKMNFCRSFVVQDLAHDVLVPSVCQNMDGLFLMHRIFSFLVWIQPLGRWCVGYIISYCTSLNIQITTQLGIWTFSHSCGHWTYSHSCGQF